MRASIRDGYDVGDDLRFAQRFVVAKEKCFVLLDGSAQASTELVLPVRRRLSAGMPGLNHGIEKIARLEFVVAQKLVC